jgi:hypothetical protein
MSDYDNFEARLRAIADEISKSVQRISEGDMEELSQRYGVDVERARAFADAAGRWLNDRFSPGDPLFGDVQRADDDSSVAPVSGDQRRSETSEAQQGSGPGPHPLDLPTGQQGVALSALDSGRWTVRPGSNQLAGTGVGAGPIPSDVVGDLRARDWITADGALTLVGRHALGRWCSTIEAPSSSASDVPPT